MEKSYHNLVGSLSVQKPSGADNLYRVKTVGMTEADCALRLPEAQGLGPGLRGRASVKEIPAAGVLCRIQSPCPT